MLHWQLPHLFKVILMHILNYIQLTLLLSKLCLYYFLIYQKHILKQMHLVLLLLWLFLHHLLIQLRPTIKPSHNFLQLLRLFLYRLKNLEDKLNWNHIIKQKFLPFLYLIWIIPFLVLPFHLFTIIIWQILYLLLIQVHNRLHTHMF